jgi:hypothetical protein
MASFQRCDPKLAHPIVYLKAQLTTRNSWPTTNIASSVCANKLVVVHIRACQWDFFISLGYFESDSQALKQDLVRVADQLSEKYRFAYTTVKEILANTGYSK